LYGLLPIIIESPLHIEAGNKPDDISARPDVAYKKEWKGWGDWLGTGNIASFKREFLPFSKANQ
jgi:hypothetical protein